MNRIKQRTKRRIIIGLCIVVAAAVIILIVQGVRGLLGGRVDTSAGLEYIQQEEAGDITAIEEKISLLEQQDNNAEDTRSIKEKFAGAVVLGDSVAEGFLEYDILNASSVAAEIGVHLDELDGQIANVKELSPSVLFLYLGMNDVTATNGDVDSFISEYRAVLTQLKEEVPDAHIFVNSIFPVQEKAIEEEPLLAKIPDYNEALKELCDSQTVAFIDNTSLVEEQYYEQDGVHFKADFYPIWAQRMAEVAAL
ncbi:MAG TPA: phospholipase [Candidatus Mediterraneibacter stercorigallinarum]|uniref:Phospholipase n=1 Tax=Candidatus Mediterraneibacter stercorigallinarum TaxID=2838686 RepID=A0A9D2D8Z6_9FIRM|nr:phospholipase [Candidatus Mediterraneibacter stercorigallinarum]